MLRHVRLRTSGSKRHWNHRFASVLSIPKFVPRVPQMLTNFGIGTLAMVRGRSLSERLARIGFSGVVLASFVLILAPLVLVVWLSFFRNEILSLPPEGYSLRWYRAIADQRQFISG